MRQDNNSPTVPATDPAALAAYYDDRKLMWRNVRWIIVGLFGTSLTMSIIAPLMNLRLEAVGVSKSGIGLIASINLWAVSFLVMYFSWKSDHCTSKWGRRIPYLLLSLPFIVGTIILFPLFDQSWILIGLMLIHLYFLDMKNSTYPLLKIDCVPKAILARVFAFSTIIMAGAHFISVRYGSRLADYNEYLPYFIAGVILTATSLLAAFRVKEPPIFNPTTERFTPFATMKVAWRDRRMIVLMAAIAMLNSFAMLCNFWMWFFAKDTLGLTRTQTGAAISWSLLAPLVLAYPVGWLIDRLGSYKVLALYWLLGVIAFITVTQVASVNGLIVLMFLLATMGPLYGAGDMIVYKQIDARDIGSFTSTVSFVRNAYVGSLVFFSGHLVELTGKNYPIVFAVGFGLTTVSIIIFFGYRSLMKRSSLAPTQIESSPETQVIADINTTEAQNTIKS